MRHAHTSRLERKTRILSEARKLMSERGWEGLTMRELARRSEVSVPTLYQLFEGKRAILASSLSLTADELSEHLHSRVGTSFATRVLSALNAAFREVERDPNYYLALTSLFAKPDVREVARQQESYFLSAITEAVRAGKASGEVADWLEPRTVARQILVACVSAIQRWAQKKIDLDAARDTAVFATCLSLAGVVRRDIAADLIMRARESQPDPSTRSPIRGRPELVAQPQF